MLKIIFHIDMNSYFATCEQQANPFLRGKPVGICEHLGGIIIAPSIEAKKLGIKTGTPVWEAKKIYPDIFLTPTDPEKYREVTHRFLKIFGEYTEKIEKFSIDEAFLDMTDDLLNFPDPWKKAEETGQEIKEKIKKAAGEWIKCSVGVGENKLIAKIASELKKPDGLVIIRPENKNMLYEKLNLIDIPGIARRTEKSLNALGIKSLKDLRDYPSSKLVTLFGIRGYHLHKIGQLEGSWKEDFDNLGEEVEDEIKSMGHAYTLPKSTGDRALTLQVLYKLSEMVGRRMRAANLSGNIISFIAHENHNYIHKRHKLDYYTDDGKEIFSEAAKILESLDNPKQKFKLIGVTVSGLKEAVLQQSLFEDQTRKKRLVKYLDQINDKHGDFTISRIPAWQARNVIRDSIGFGRMKEFKINYKKGKA